MFFRLRTEVLAAGLARLEPRPMGRPRSTTSAEEEQLATMADRIAELEKQLLVSHVREEVAQLRAASANDADEKNDTEREESVAAKTEESRPAEDQGSLTLNDACPDVTCTEQAVTETIEPTMTAACEQIASRARAAQAERKQRARRQRELAARRCSTRAYHQMRAPP